MKTNLSDAEEWTELEAGQDRIKLIKLINQLIQFQDNNTKEQKQVARTTTEEGQSARPNVRNALQAWWRMNRRRVRDILLVRQSK